MTKLDPELINIKRRQTDEIRALASSRRFDITVADRRAKPLITVLVQHDGEQAALEAAGLAIHTVAGDVVTGSLSVDALDKLAAVDGVVRIEASRQIDLVLDNSLPETRAELVHSGPPGRRGAGVIVGVVDSGIDFTHGSFRRVDGTSRLLAIWDQNLAPGTGESSPAPFGYGVQWEKAAIDTAIASADPFSVVRHKDQPDANFHGTHVSGIAAGDGSDAGNAQPAFTYVGVAPEADIVLVATNFRSAGIVDGAKHIFDLASSLNRPAVVNLSLGGQIGPHDGTSVMERGLDNLLGGAGRAIVAAAGNEANDDIHARGTVSTGVTTTVRWRGPGVNPSDDVIDLWYPGSDSFSVRVRSPGGDATGNVAVGGNVSVTLPNGNQVSIDHRNNDPENGDKRIFIVVEPGTTANIQSGDWSIELTGVSVANGTFDAWLWNARGLPRSQFLAPHRDVARTMAMPATATRMISVASYVTRGAGVGSLSSFSNRGPTRDDRAAPTVAAPGQVIIAAKGHDSANPYQPLQGTSMASPHVAGAVALMFQKNDSYRWDQIRDCLASSARTDADTGPTPNTAWGGGKLDVQAALACVRPKLVVAPTLDPRDPRCARLTVDPRDPRCRFTLPRDPRCPQPTIDPRDLRCRFTLPRDPRCPQPTIDPRDPRCGPVPPRRPFGAYEDYGTYADYGYDPYADWNAADWEGADLDWADVAVSEPGAPVAPEQRDYYEYDESYFDVDNGD